MIEARNIITDIRNIVTARILRAHTDIRTQKGAIERFKDLVKEGGVPILYANHQMHTDGMPLASVEGYLRDATRGRRFFGRHSSRDAETIRGFATLLAITMENGQQGEELKSTYDLLVGGAQRMGLLPIAVTRQKDQDVYGADRKKIGAESLPLARALRAGYGIAFLPEGTVEGGRHPEGSSIEEINGMQVVRNDRLIRFFEFAERILISEGKWPFYQPVSLHGSFRIMQSPKEGKPELTKEGKISLIMATAGIPFGVIKIQANILMPITEKEIIADLGDGWRSDPTAFNSYAMRRIAPYLPVVARGVYA